MFFSFLSEAPAWRGFFYSAEILMTYVSLTFEWSHPARKASSPPHAETEQWRGTARNQKYGLAHIGPQAEGHQYIQEWSGEFHTPTDKADISPEQDTVRRFIDRARWSCRFALRISFGNPVRIYEITYSAFSFIGWPSYYWAICLHMLCLHESFTTVHVDVKNCSSFCF